METKKLNAGDLSFICTQISMFLRAGVPLADGLALMKGETGRQIYGVVDALANVINNRKPLSEAMEVSGRFPAYLIRMTRTGEVSGNLDSVMENMARFYEREDKLTRQVREAVIYPLILLIMLGAAVFFIVTRVLPMFGEILADLGGEIPMFVRWLMDAGVFLERNYLWLLGILAVLAAAIIVLMYTPKGRQFFHKYTAKLSLVRKLSAARFAGAMGVLLSGGVAVDTALDLSQDLLKNTHMKMQLDWARQNFGYTAQVLEKAEIFPAKFTIMFAAGCESGEDDTAMERLAALYAAETDRTLERLTGSIEPVMSAVLSVLVGVILVSVILPLIQIMSFIG